MKILFTLLSGIVVITPALSQTATKDWNVAFLDSVLSAAGTNQAVQLGDMQVLVRNVRAWRDQLAGGPNPNLAFDGSAPIWTAGNLYYTFDPSVSAFNQKVSLDGMAEWAMFANLHFIPRTTQSNYFTIRLNPSIGGGQSAVGMIGGQQFLDIGPNAWNHPTLCHELGHTLGLVHEHQRSDRDLYVTILTNNVDPTEMGNFVKLGDSNNRGAYDFLGVMHYNRSSFPVTPGLDTIVPLPAYMHYIDIMGVQFDPVLSALDRSGLASVYGAGPAITAVVTNTQDSGPGSLRGALYYAFDHPGTTITFSLLTSDPGFSNHVFNIKPTDNLPSLFNATTLNGANGPTNSNPNGPSILLNGELAQTSSVFVNGLRMRGTNSSIRSLIINGFIGDGILIEGTNATLNSVRGCWLGLDATGSNAVPNGLPNITIQNGGSSNTIGGALPGDRNVISGNQYQGLVIRDPGSRNNIIEGNYIGLNVTGTAAVSNSWAGINIFNGAASNLIGGTISSMRNVISGNGYQGIAISDANSSGNVIQGNYIGISPAGTNAIGNGWAGIDLFSGPEDTLVGGTISGAGNVISGNGDQGIAVSSPGTFGTVIQGNYIGVNPTGVAAIPNGWGGVEVYGGAQATIIGGTSPAARNIISGNGDQGVSITGTNTTGNLVQGNYIGVDQAGLVAIGNGWAGVAITGGAQSNTVGGTIPGATNIIAGNGNQGVAIANPGTTLNVVQGNCVGLNATGNAVSNTWSGVALFDRAQSNLIGGPLPSMRNIISGNGNQGIFIADTNTSGNIVQGNYIGTSPSGSSAVSNAWAGIEFYNGACSNLIGGSFPGAGNLVSGNGNQGIVLSVPGTIGNLIKGNFVGVNVMGTLPISNGWAGVEFYGGASANIVGGGLGDRNIISGNGGAGVQLSGIGTDANLIQGNTIGFNVTASSKIPNGGAGVSIFNGPRSTQIGGVGFGAANLIAGNLSDGVQLFDPGTSNNIVRANSIFSNSGDGLILYSSANGAIQGPTLTNAVVTTVLTIGGNLISRPSTTFHLDFYGNPPPSSVAQARSWLGSIDATTGAGGSVNFNAVLTPLLHPGAIVRATATDPAGNTSSLSSFTTVTAVDSVGDGIPNAWRAAKFGGTGAFTNSQSCATCDPDGDGLNNLQEFRAGTTPTNAASTLRLAAPARNGTNIMVGFQSVTNIVYRIEAATDFPRGPWTLLADQLLSPGGIVQITDPGAAGALSRRFYRLSVVP